MLTRDAIEEFMLSRGGLRPRSQKEYRKHLELFERSFPDLPETPQLIQSWLNDFKGVTPETVHARFRTLRAFYKQLYLFHNIPNLMLQVRPPKLKRKAMRTFTDQELFTLFSLSLTPRESALLTLLLDIGPRAGECVNLTWDGVTPGFVTLQGKTGERIVPISETTYRRLTALSNDSSHVFLGKRGPLTYEGIYKLVRHLCQRAGISGRRSSPHTFRHSFATNYAAAEGCDPKVLQDIMGHRDFKSTLRYIQNNPKRMALNHQRCTPLKLLVGAAQGSLFSQDLDTSRAMKEAEYHIVTEEPPPKGGEEIGESALDEEGFHIDLTWLKESLNELKWSDDTCKTFVASQYKVSPRGTLEDVLKRLTREQAEEFVKEIREKVSKKQGPLFE